MKCCKLGLHDYHPKPFDQYDWDHEGLTAIILLCFKCGKVKRI